MATVKKPIKKAQDGDTYTKDGDKYTATVTVKTSKGPRKYSASSTNMAFAKELASNKQFTNPADSVSTVKKTIKQKNGGITKAKDGMWMQKAAASIKKRGTAGKCTPITKPGCTGKAKALAKTFKKIAKSNKKK
jgi:hypothetical protein